MRRSFKQVLIGAVAAVAVSAGIAAPMASAAFVSIENKNSGLLFEVPGWSTAQWTTLDQWYYNRKIWSGYVFAGENQQWIVPEAGQTFTIRNRNSQKCVATNGAGRAVYQATCTGGWEQLWRRADFRVTEYNGDFSSAIYSSFTNPATGLVLDVDHASKSAGAVVMSFYPNGGDNQTWFLSSRSLWDA